MARKSRVKEITLPHHIICRSIEEVDLFKNNVDKEDYIKRIRKASEKYGIQVLAYCLMTNHVHLLVHPKGGDISNFMRDINSIYARMYNLRHSRRGSLFSERFKNIVVRSNTQLIRTSIYIHNNIKDLLYNSINSMVTYPYSSLRAYIRPPDKNYMVRASQVLKLLSRDMEEAISKYCQLMIHVRTSV